MRHVDIAGSSGELPDQEVSDFAVSETDEGRLEWKMYARSAAIYNVRNVIIAHGVRIDFYDEKGKQTSTLTAREGEMNQIKRDMVARGNVVLRTAEGRMSTQQLKFLNEKQRIISDDFVRVERDGGDVLTGYGFESDPNLEHFEFKRKVKAIVRTRSGGVLEPRQGSR